MGQKRTLGSRLGMSAKFQKRTLGQQKRPAIANFMRGRGRPK
jgi:hypothetical protein